MQSQNILFLIFYFIFLKILFIYLFIYGCVGSSFLCEGFLQLRQVGATLQRGAQASHHRGPSRCGAQAPDAQAQQLWLTGLVASRHVGSSQTRARTRVPCIGRQTLNHCATGEALIFFYLSGFWFIHVNACISSSFIFIEWHSIIWIYQNFKNPFNCWLIFGLFSLFAIFFPFF